MTETLNPRPVVLGGYAAKTCPEKLRLEHDPAYADLPLEPFPAGVQARMDAGNVFEAEVRAAWSKVLRRKMAILDSGDGSWEAKGAREAATLALLASPGAVTVIWNPRLPAQPGAHRIGEPDALVLDHVDAAGAARWIPVDVKDHRALDGTAAHTTVASPLNRPGYASARPVDIGPGTPRRDDALQLAHYRRMLEHLGHATDVPVGAIIGREMQLIWHDLDAALYRHGTLGKTSALTWYDHEFARRVQIATIARSGTSTPAPEWKADCASCPWRKVCHDELTATDHATLLPGVTPDRAGRLLYPAGITTRRQLAAWQATGEKTDTQIRPLADQARVTLAGKVHRARGIDTVTLPHATVEVDFDLENTPDGLVYLIVLTTTTTRRAAGTTTRSTRTRVFADWTGTETGEAQLFADFWTALTGTQATARRGHRSFQGFHYSPHERSTFKRLALRHASHPGVPTVEQVEAFLDTHVTDLYAVLAKQLIWPTESYSIKDLAKWARFSWRDGTPGGDNSMAWYASAVDPALTDAEQTAWQQRLVDYCEDDVAAQRHLRDWVRSLLDAWDPNSKLPAVETLEGAWRRRSRAQSPR